MSDLVINVKQISNYPTRFGSNGGETLLLQPGGLGSPYASISAANLVGTALSNGYSIGVGSFMPDLVGEGQVFTNEVVLPNGGALLWNIYVGTANDLYVGPGTGARYDWEREAGYVWLLAPAAQAADQVLPLNTYLQLMNLDNAGDLSLYRGTLAVARDPNSLNEVTTLGWIQRNTVANFNNRIGAVTLNSADIYQALNYDSLIATENYVTSAIQQGIQNLLMTCPFVNTWNDRSGKVYLMLSDITCVFFQSGQQPITPTPPATSDDFSIANTQWVVNYVTETLAGDQGLATKAWVEANTVTSFNGRQGTVTLVLADVTTAGGAPIDSPDFTGLPMGPTANPGTSTAQLATTAFVQAAITASTAGVASFNTRTGAVTLTAADITAAGGLANPSPALTGTPTAPTPAPGDNSTNIATTAFVQAAVAASTAGVASFNTRTGDVTLTATDITQAGGLANPNVALTGVPTAPTAAPGTSTTQLATTAFVQAAITGSAAGVSSFNGRTGAVTLSANDITAAGGLANPNVALTGTPTAPTATAGTNTTQLATTAFVQSAVTAGVQAGMVSPSFTGTPTGPTASPGTSTTQLATTAFVMNALSSMGAGVTSFNTRTGAVTLTLNDITNVGGAPIASPNFTGTPTAPTGAKASTTQIATQAYIQTYFIPLTGSTAITGPLVSTGNFQGANLYASAGAVELGAQGGAANTPTFTTPSGGVLNIWAQNGSNLSQINLFGAGVLLGGLTQVAGHFYPNRDDNSYCGITGNGWSGVYSYYYGTLSDRRAKLDIHELPECTAILEAIDPKRFRWDRLPDDNADPFRDDIHWGFIAQEVRDAMGSLAFGGHRMEANGEQTLSYDELMAVLWKACQEMSARIATLEGKIP